LGGYLPPFNIQSLDFIPGIIWFLSKIAFLLFIFLWIRATLPRYRYDQLMHLGWKVFLPLSLLWVILVSGVLLYTEHLPHMVKSSSSYSMIPAEVEIHESKISKCTNSIPTYVCMTPKGMRKIT